MTAPTDYRIQIVQKPNEQRVDVLIDGAEFCAYIYPDFIKKPVLYPLRTADGTVVTRGYPLDPRPRERVDHPHHVGLWFNYGAVNGLDFWNHSDAVPEDQRGRYGTIRHRRVVKAESGNERGELAATSEWMTPEGETLLREDATFVFAGDGTTRVVDRIATLTALVDVTFKDDKEGLLGLRVASELEAPDKNPALRLAADGSGKEEKFADEKANGLYRGSNGLEGDAVWASRGDWMKLAGKVAGETCSITVFDHPRNPGYPTYWHARGYGLFAANPLGQAVFSEGKEELNFALPAGASATFRYRIRIDCRRNPSDEELNAEFEQFSRA